MPALEVLPRVVLAAVLGAVIGFERDVHGHPAGLRTHATVGIASATFMIVSTRLPFYQHYDSHDLATAVVVTAVGLGALTVLRRVEDRRDPLPRHRVTLLLDDKLASVRSVVEAFARAGAKAAEQELEVVVGDGTTRVTLEIRSTAPLENHDLARAIESHTGIREIKLERL